MKYVINIPFLVVFIFLAACPALAGKTEPEGTGGRVWDSSEYVESEIAWPENKKNFVVVLAPELIFGFAALTAWGVGFWDWFREPFSVVNEHGFSDESSTGGADKVGHAWTAFVFADIAAHQLRSRGFGRNRAAVFGALSSMMLMTYIEVGDAFGQHGGSWEDLIADAAGAGLSLLLGFVPPLDTLIDFRWEYWPTGEYLEHGEVSADYSGMKYALAFSGAGMGPLARTPLRYFELQVGYYSRGYRSWDEDATRTRTLYFGVGIDVKEVLNAVIRSAAPNHQRLPNKIVDTVFSYYQPPKTHWEFAKIESTTQGTSESPE